MLTSLNWLKEYVDIDVTPEELNDILTDSGTKVETIETVNDKMQGIVAGKILKIEKHPNADRLSLCTVDVGKEEPLTIITSATNVNEGDLVPVAVKNSRLADGTKMKDTKFRGIKSQGMFCSVEELGMPKDLFQKEITEGIYILPEDFVPVGTELKGPLWIDDQIIDIELTANRGDCQSIYGIAREAAAALDKSIKPLDLSLTEGEEDISDYLSVEVESDYCPRYTARMFKVNKIEPSPLWMQLKLLNSGVRPINNIVDVTNYVMLEMGQPLHAFDYRSIGSDKIVVKTNNKEKTVTTLDEKERPITEEMLMITNGEHPIAVAGVMGGLNSEITDDTELVVLESANFDKTSIRLTSRDLGLRTESSARYEKGIYPELAAEASARAAHLFSEIGAATPINGYIDIIRKENKDKDIDIIVDIDWLNNFLGIDLDSNEIRNYLNRLFLGTNLIDDNTLIVRVPEYRQDLRIKEDIAEEVARLYGYNNIPSTIMSGETFVGEKTPEQKFEDLLTRTLVGLGLYQTMTTSFVGPSKIKDLGLNPDEDKVEIINPLGEESSIMRSSLIPSQLDIISLNNNRGNTSGKLFEIQKTYHENEPGELPNEEKKVVISEFGNDIDFFDLKGKVEILLDEAGIKDYEFIPGGNEYFHPGRKAQVKVGDTVLGELGEIHPNVIKNYDLPRNVFVGEFSLDNLFNNANNKIEFKDLPRYPDTSRDLAIVLDETIPANSIQKLIKKFAGENLESLELFDVYTGEQVPENKKSLAYHLIFRHPERTLTDEEINPIIDTIIEELEKQYNAFLR